MRYYGNVGYSITSETSPGIWSEDIIKRPYVGDVIKVHSRWSSKSDIVDDIELSNQISIVADPFAYENFQHMRSIEFMGAEWKIVTVEVQRPRIILTIGGVYNGQ